AAHAVVRVLAVEAGVGPARLAQVGHPARGPLAQLVQRPELDGIGRAGLGAGGFHAVAEPVVGQRALPDPAVPGPLVDHAVRAGRDAVAAAVADVLLHYHRAELGPEQRAGRADVQAGGVGAVLAHVGGHQPAQLPVRTRGGG